MQRALEPENMKTMTSETLTCEKIDDITGIHACIHDHIPLEQRRGVKEGRMEEGRVKEGRMEEEGRG